MSAEERNTEYEKKNKEGKEVVVFRVNSEIADSIAFRMMMNNTISGIFPMSHSFVDDYMELAFQLQGETVVSDLAESGKLEFSFLISFYLSLHQTIQSGKSYFLEENGYFLVPEVMTWNRKSAQVSVCYVPDITETLQQKLKILTEYFMEHLNHKDKKAVALLYGIYDEICLDHFSFDGVKELVLEYQSQMNSEHQNQMEKEEQTQTNFGWQNQNQMEAGQQNEANLKLSQPDLQSSERIVLKLQSKHPYAPEEMTVTDCYVRIGREFSNGVVIPYNTVSRRHAICYQEGGQVVLEDLDSLNGTFRNGKKISAKEKIYCKNKDIITFADIQYQIISI